VPRQGAGSVVVGRNMIDCKDLIFPGPVFNFDCVVPGGSSVGRARHHESIRSEQLST